MVWLPVTVWLLASGLAAQVEEAVEEAVEPATYGEATEALRAEFDAAMELFQSVDQAESITLFSGLIENLLGEEAPPPGLRRDILTQALFRRAEARLNLGENEAADADLETVARIDPGFDPDALLVSPKLRQLFEQARDRVAGYLDPRLEPADAEVRLDGSRILLGREGSTPVLAGTYQVRVERAGYSPVEREIEVVPGEMVPLEASLERVSATVRVRTVEAGVEVALDGVSQGATRVIETLVEGHEVSGDESEAIAEPVATDVGETPGVKAAELLVDGLSIGEHILDLSKEGFRSGRVELTIESLTDYEMETVELEETRGTLYIENMPADASLLIDGEVLFPAGSVEGDLNLPLPVGEHLLQGDAGTLGGFEHYFGLEDRGEVTVDARLKPRLVLLGILGGDAEAAQRLRDALAARFDGHPHWLYSDRSEEMRPQLADLGLDSGRLRAGGAGSVDWKPVQAEADRLVPGSVYLIAVLSDDLLATEADLWTIPSAPSAAVAGNDRVELNSDTSLDQWASAFASPPAWDRAWLGATLLDSGLGDGPVIAIVDPEGPLAEADARPGDVVATVSGAPVSSPRDVTDAFAAAGERVEISLLRAGETVALTVPVVRRPAVVVDPDSAGPGAASLAWAAIEEARGGVADWVLALNRADAYRREASWLEVVLVLRAVGAPEETGLGQAAVDYWLGVALLETDPIAYAEQAREALGRAAESQAGRLESADGPRVAPRARARLQALGPSPESAGK